MRTLSAITKSRCSSRWLANDEGVPIHKCGVKHSPLNYRLISVTSVPWKIFEHVIFSGLVTFLDSNNIFTPSQHEFRKTYSCETQLVSLVHSLHAIRDRRSQADYIFLDFPKAFDKINHDLLRTKIRSLNIDQRMFNVNKTFPKQSLSVRFCKWCRVPSFPGNVRRAPRLSARTFALFII